MYLTAKSEGSANFPTSCTVGYLSEKGLNVALHAKVSSLLVVWPLFSEPSFYALIIR